VSPTRNSQRRAPHHLIAIRHPIDRADPARGRIEDRQIRRCARERVQQSARIVARHREARLRGRRRRGEAAQASSQHGGGGFQRLCEHFIMGRFAGGRLLQRLGLRRRQIFGDLLDRRPVGLAEEHIESDDRGAFTAQFVNQIAELRPRPRPLPEFRERGLVDIDDADRQLRIVGLRRELLIGVEGDQAQGAHEKRIDRAHHHCDCEQRKNEQVRPRSGSEHLYRIGDDRTGAILAEPTLAPPATEKKQPSAGTHG
jgi:hypothetical protein